MNSENCATCGKDGESMVMDSRPTEFGRMRRRRCLWCDARWTTMEVPYEAAKAARSVREDLDRAIEGLVLVRDALPPLIVAAE